MAISKKSVIRYLALPIACYVVLNCVIIWFFVSNWISPVGFGRIELALCVALFFISHLRLKAAQRNLDAANDQSLVPLDEPAKRSIRQTIWIISGVAFLMLATLANGLWTERGHLSWPALIGASMNLLFVTGMVVTLRRLRSSLK